MDAPGLESVIEVVAPVLQVPRESCTLVISNMSKCPALSKIMTTMPASNPHSSFPVGQLLGSLTFSSFEFGGMPDCDGRLRVAVRNVGQQDGVVPEHRGAVLAAARGMIGAKKFRSDPWSSPDTTRRPP